MGRPTLFLAAGKRHPLRCVTGPLSCSYQPGQERRPSCCRPFPPLAPRLHPSSWCPSHAARRPAGRSSPPPLPQVPVSEGARRLMRTDMLLKAATLHASPIPGAPHPASSAAASSISAAASSPSNKQQIPGSPCPSIELRCCAHLGLKEVLQLGAILHRARGGTASGSTRCRRKAQPCNAPRQQLIQPTSPSHGSGAAMRRRAGVCPWGGPPLPPSLAPGLAPSQRPPDGCRPWRRRPGPMSARLYAWHHRAQPAEHARADRRGPPRAAVHRHAPSSLCRTNRPAAALLLQPCGGWPAARVPPLPTPPPDGRVGVAHRMLPCWPATGHATRCQPGHGRVQHGPASCGCCCLRPRPAPAPIAGTAHARWAPPLPRPVPRHASTLALAVRSRPSLSGWLEGGSSAAAVIPALAGPSSPFPSPVLLAAHLAGHLGHRLRHDLGLQGLDLIRRQRLR